MSTVMSWRSTLTLTLLAGAMLSAWSVWTGRSGTPADTASVTRSDYVLHDFELVALDANGQESFTLRAPRLVREPGKQSMMLDTPLFLLPDSEQPDLNKQYWQIRAQSGWVSADGNELRLRDDVRVNSPPQARKVAMNTEQLNVYPDKKLATSAVAVTITQPGSILRGRGLETNLASKHYLLKSQVRTHYVPQR